MSEKNPMPTGKELAARFDAASPATKAEMLVELLTNNPNGLRDVIANRTWTATDDYVGHGSAWPTDQGDHKNESTWEGRTP